MGGEETVTEVSEAAANGTAAPEQKEDDFALKKEGGKDEVKEMEEDGKDDGKVEMQKMDMDIEGKENEQTLEGKKEEEKKQNEEENEEKKEEAESEAMEEETKAKTERGEEKVEGKADELTDVEERTEENKREKASKRRGRGKSAGAKIGSAKKDVEEKKELKTPVVSVSERPVRERKSVERLVASIEKDSVKEFHIEKGSGTALKDIPNVSYKISKRKNDDILKLLHTILFGRRGKAIQIKSNISRFSGFVWKENEEKQKIKVKEKLDKCVKEKLLEFCDVLDIPMAKATTKKEEIVIKLIDFLVAPHATTTELLAEKEQSSKGKKRKRVVKPNASLSGSTPSKRSAKSQKVIEDATEGEKNKTLETEDKSDEEEEEEEETMNGIPEKSKTDVPQHSESGEDKDEFEDESEEDTSKKKRGSKKSSAKKESVEKPKSKKVRTPKKSGPPTKRTPGKSSSNHPKVDDNSDSSPKTFSRKKRTETVKQKSLAPKKPSSKEKTGKKVATGKDKPKEDKLKPSDDELRNAIVEILKEVDFNTATFTDILKQLAGRFKLDLTPRKSSIKLMIQDELTKLADEADDEEDEGDADADADAEKDETEPSRQGVEA